MKDQVYVVIACFVLGFTATGIGLIIKGESDRAKFAASLSSYAAYQQGFSAGLNAALTHVKVKGTNASLELEDVLKEMKWPK